MRGSRKKQQQLQQEARMGRKRSGSDGDDNQPRPAEEPDGTTDHTFLIEPRDPLVFRDARPFSAEPGAGAFCLPFPLPRTVAGALRTHIGNTARPRIDWTSHDDTSKVARVVVHGPLLLGRATGESAWQVRIPAPRDAVFYRDDTKNLHGMILRPMRIDSEEDAGSNLPKAPSKSPANGCERALANTALRPMDVSEEVKPESKAPAWWQIDDAVRWLAAHTGTESDLPLVRSPGNDPAIRGMASLPHDTRVHVGIDAGTLTHREGALFTTEAVAFPEKPMQPDEPNEPETPAAAMVCRVKTDIDWRRDDAHLPLGGERRLARIRVDDADIAWPDVVFPPDEAFRLSNGLRLLLVTPALFAHGWLPAWMADATIPGLGELKTPVQLVGAATDRRIPVSGWGITRKQGANHKETGARATRYAVPAGGVYFFRFNTGIPDLDTWKTIWERLWLAPVSDRQIDRDSGFGLVLPGLWREETATGASESEG